MRVITLSKLTLLLLLIFSIVACTTEAANTIDDTVAVEDPTDETEDNNEGLTPKTTYDITSIIEKLTAEENVSYEIDGEYVRIFSTGIPNHKSPYFIDTDWENEKYEAYSSSTFRLNPNRIDTQDYEFRIPLHPTVASNKTTTPMGPMGVAINGVPLFNQYAAGGVDLTNEIFSFDQYSGHPTLRGMYHYHIEPIYLTEQNGADALLGVLLDGFPVYGPLENGETLSSDDLDDYHGHFSATKEFPEGIYHYHISADAPYINGDGFYGVAGTVSN